MPHQEDSDCDDDDEAQSMSSLLDRLKSFLDEDSSGPSVSARELQRMIEDGTLEKSLPQSLGASSLKDMEEMLDKAKRLAKEAKKSEKDGKKWKRCMDRFMQFWERLAVIAALPVPAGDFLIRMEFEWLDKNFIEQQVQNGWNIREPLRSIVLLGERDPHLLLSGLDKNETGQIKRFLEMVAESEKDSAHLKDTWNDGSDPPSSITESSDLYGLSAKKKDLNSFRRLLELLSFLIVNEPAKKDQLELRDKYRSKVNCMEEALQRAGCQLLLPTFDLLCRKADPASVNTEHMSTLDAQLVQWLMQMVQSGEIGAKKAAKKFRWNLQSLKLVAGELVVDTQAEEFQKLGAKQFVQSKAFWARIAKLCLFPHLAPFGRAKNCAGGVKIEKKKLLRELHDWEKHGWAITSNVKRFMDGERRREAFLEGASRSELEMLRLFWDTIVQPLLENPAAIYRDYDIWLWRVAYLTNATTFGKCPANTGRFGPGGMTNERTRVLTDFLPELEAENDMQVMDGVVKIWDGERDRRRLTEGLDELSGRALEAMLDVVEECETGTPLPVPTIAGGPADMPPSLSKDRRPSQSLPPAPASPVEPGSTLKEAVAQLAGRTGEPFNHARVFLAGDGRAGKTALCNSIMGRPFTETHSTCGVDQHFLQVLENQWTEYDRKATSEYKHVLAMAAARCMQGAREEDHGDDILAGAVEQPTTISTLQTFDDADQFNKKGKKKRDTSQPGQEPGAPSSPDTPPSGQPPAMPPNGNNATPTPAVDVVPAGGGGARPERVPSLAEEDVEQALVEHYTQQESAQNPLKLMAWDFGGQEVFSTLHPLFLTPYGVYLVVFDMRRLCSGASEAAHAACLSNLRYWICSIVESTRSETENNAAPIFLVGTHKDTVSDVAEHRRIDELLSTKLNRYIPNHRLYSRGQTDEGCSVLSFWPIENTAGTRDLVVAQLRNEIYKVVSAERYVKDVVPYRWLKVFDMLMSDNRVQLTVHELVDLATTCGLPSDAARLPLETEVHLLARFLSDLGYIMYHQDTAPSNSLVILNPAEFLVAPATKVICDFMKHSSSMTEHEICKRRFQTEWTSLTTRGILSRRLLPILWEAFSAHSQQLEILMVRFGLFLPFLSSATEETLPEEQQYLVPALLPKALPAEPDPAGHTFILLFGSESVVRAWRKLQKMGAERSAQEGFMPNGLWAQVLNGVVAACQLAHGSFDDLELTQDEATVVLGHCHFTLQRRPQLNGIAVRVTSQRDGDPRYVLEWFQDCVSGALHPSAAVDSTAFSRISFLAAVPQGPVNLARTSDDIWKQDLVLLQSEKGVEATVACRGEMRIGKELLSTAQLTERFAVWLEAQGPQMAYHAFISYRWAALDKKISSSLYTALNRRHVNNERVVIFRDQERLMTGRPLQDDFCSALARSTVALPIVSPESLEKFALLDSPANANIDNVLLEWTLILELLHHNRLKGCIPIWIGKKPSDSAADKERVFWRTHEMSLPEITAPRVADKVKEQLEKKGLTPSPKLFTRTVRQTVDEILGFMGVTSWSVTNVEAAGPHAGLRWLQRFVDACAEKAFVCISDLHQPTVPIDTVPVPIDIVPAVVPAVVPAPPERTPIKLRPLSLRPLPETPTPSTPRPAAETAVERRTASNATTEDNRRSEQDKAEIWRLQSELELLRSASTAAEQELRKELRELREMVKGKFAPEPAPAQPKKSSMCSLM